MKLQNTLFIATAICFYILLCSQPADSHSKVQDWNGFRLDRDGFELCSLDGTCSNENFKCFYPGVYYLMRGYCVHPCQANQTCLDENHKCIVPVNTYDCQIEHCIPLTNEQVFALPECDNDRKCKNFKTCVRIWPTESSPTNRCLKFPIL